MNGNNDLNKRTVVEFPKSGVVLSISGSFHHNIDGENPTRWYDFDIESTYEGKVVGSYSYRSEGHFYDNYCLRYFLPSKKCVKKEFAIFAGEWTDMLLFIEKREKARIKKLMALNASTNPK